MSLTEQLRQWRRWHWSRVSVWMVTLSLLGVGVSTYLTVEHFTADKVLACPENSVINCQRVTTSPQSSFLGIPVAVLGLIFFVAMAAATLPPVWRDRRPLFWRGRLALIGAGVAFVLYLIYAELFWLDAICLWCTVVHVVTLALFVILAFATAAELE